VGRLAVKFRSGVPLPAVTARTNLPWEKAMGSTLQYRRISFFIVLMLALAGLTGCASISPTAQQSAAEPVANATTPAKTQSRPHHGLAIARDMVGTPYRYGGADPRGFDCSGLVYYSYRKANIEVPRTAAEQYRQSTRVKISHMRPGDLVFFRISQDKLSHVGIYAGSGRFIHAPSSGKRVSYASLHNPYWEARVLGAGRLQ
jgi:cell wall-associated NlpC family hydrolase